VVFVGLTNRAVNGRDRSVLSRQSYLTALFLESLENTFAFPSRTADSSSSTSFKQRREVKHE
jgi:hypothetical protein